MKDGLNREVDVEVKPIEMMRRRQRDIEQLADRRIAKPRKLGEWNEILALRSNSQKPCADTLATSTSDMVVRGAADDIFVLLKLGV
jgi:hypothetical protein